MARRRPTAFDVSFPEERDDCVVADVERSSSVASTASLLGKRKGDLVGDARVCPFYFLRIQLSWFIYKNLLQVPKKQQLPKGELNAYMYMSLELK